MKFSAVALATTAALALSAPSAAAFAGCNIQPKKLQGVRVRCAQPHSKELESEQPNICKTAPSSNRRNFLQFGGALPFIIQDGKAVADGTFASERPLADLPMRRLRLPKPAAGRDYVLLQLKVGGEGPFFFMIDSGLTTEMITPHLQKTLGIEGSKTVIKGLAAGGATSGGALVDLSGASVCCGKFADPTAEELALPPLHAVVTDFPQAHMDPAHDPVEGMVGMEMLNLFDTDLDFPAGRIRLWAPGTAMKAAARAGLVEVPAAVLNETLLLGMRVTSATKPKMQPVVGVIDCGSSFSALNWAAADLVGLPPQQDTAYVGKPSIYAVGVDGRPLTLPTTDVQMTFVGNPSTDRSGNSQFAPPPQSWHPWAPVQLAIGDLPVFSELLGDGKTPYNGPAALIGLDILSQRRVILETSSDMGRRRRLFVSPK